MFCTSCGMKIQENDLRCKYCGELQIPEEKDKIEEINLVNQKNKVKRKKKRIVLLCVILMAVVSVFVYLKSDSGRLVQARICMAFHKHSLAYDIIYKGMSEEAFTYRKYADVIVKVSDLCELSTQNESMQAINELEQSINKLSENNYLLKENEITKLSLLKARIAIYKDSVEDISDFEKNLQTAYGVYEELEKLEKGESFHAEVQKSKFMKCKDALEDANEYYKTAIGSSMYGYIEISIVLDEAIAEMNRIINKYEDCSNIYYTNFSLYDRYTNPHDESFMEKTKDQLNKDLVQDCFRDLL